MAMRLRGAAAVNLIRVLLKVRSVLFWLFSSEVWHMDPRPMSV